MLKLAILYYGMVLVFMALNYTTNRPGLHKFVTFWLMWVSLACAIYATIRFSMETL